MLVVSITLTTTTTTTTTITTTTTTTHLSHIELLTNTQFRGGVVVRVLVVPVMPSLTCELSPYQIKSKFTSIQLGRQINYNWTQWDWNYQFPTRMESHRLVMVVVIATSRVVVVLVVVVVVVVLVE